MSKRRALIAVVTVMALVWFAVSALDKGDPRAMVPRMSDVNSQGLLPIVGGESGALAKSRGSRDLAAIVGDGTTLLTPESRARLDAISRPIVGSKEYQRFHTAPAVEVYEHYIAAAEGGDADAQYLLSRLFEVCQMSISTRILDHFKASGFLPQEAIDQLQRQHQRCVGLGTYVSGDEGGREAFQYWRDEADENGNAVARAAKAISALPRREDYTVDPASDAATAAIVRDAIIYSRGSPLLREKAVELGYFFFRHFRETEYNVAFDTNFDAGHYKQGPRSSAWSLGYCIYTIDCDAVELADTIAEYYYQYEVDEILVETEVFMTALDEGDWTRLGLE